VQKTFGEDHSLFKELFGLLQQCRMEAHMSKDSQRRLRIAKKKAGLKLPESFWTNAFVVRGNMLTRRNQTTSNFKKHCILGEGSAGTKWNELIGTSILQLRWLLSRHRRLLSRHREPTIDLFSVLVEKRRGQKQTRKRVLRLKKILEENKKSYN